MSSGNKGIIVEVQAWYHDKLKDGAFKGKTKRNPEKKWPG